MIQQTMEVTLYTYSSQTSR